MRPNKIINKVKDYEIFTYIHVTYSWFNSVLMRFLSMLWLILIFLLCIQLDSCPMYFSKHRSTSTTNTGMYQLNCHPATKESIIWHSSVLIIISVHIIVLFRCIFSKYHLAYLHSLFFHLKPSTKS